MVALAFVVLGLVIGCIGTIIGAGGGFILVPILYLIHPDWSVEVITATSLAVVFFNATSGSIAYARMGRIDYKSGRTFVVASIPGVILGAVATQHVPRELFGAVFGLLLLLLAATIFKLSGHLKARGDEHGHVHVSETLTHVITAGIGLLSSLLGIGGGIIHVPFLVHSLGFPVHKATATSHYVLAFMSGLSVLVHIYYGAYRDAWSEALLIGVGVVAGAQLGARLSHRIKGPWITRSLALALIFVALRLIWQNVL